VDLIDVYFMLMEQIDIKNLRDHLDVCVLDALEDQLQGLGGNDIIIPMQSSLISQHIKQKTSSRLTIS